MILEVFDHTSGELVNSINEAIENFDPEELYWKVCDTVILTFSFLTDFSYFPLKNKLPNVAGHCQNRSKMEVFKGGCRRFQLFFIYFQLFYFLARIIPATITVG